MKTAKRLLALALAGVMALALLTGCSDSSSEARQVEEYFRYRRDNLLTIRRTRRWTKSSRSSHGSSSRAGWMVEEIG